MSTRSGTTAALLWILLMYGRPAHAQLGWTFHSLAEVDTNDLILALADVTVGPRREGWTPIAVLQANWLRFPTSSDDRSTLAALPSLGLRHGFSTGALSFRAGYNFSDSELGAAPVAAAEVGPGVVNAVELERWGTGSFGAQALASYNYGSEVLWLRARLTRQLSGLFERIRLGAEAVYLNAPGRSQFQPGLLIGFHPSGSSQFTLAAGVRLENGARPTYIRTELKVGPAR